MLNALSATLHTTAPRLELQGKRLTGALIRHQCQRLWCWAAVAEYLHAVLANRTRDQGSIASSGGRNCKTRCLGTAPAGCDRPRYLPDVLREENLLGAELEVSWEAIKNEIQQGRPPAFRVGIPNSRGHFGAISGWAIFDSLRFVEIMDPAGGLIRYIPYETFIGDYPGWGAVSNLYSTQNSGGHVSILSEAAQFGIDWANPTLFAGLTSATFARSLSPEDLKARAEKNLNLLLSMGIQGPRALKGINPNRLAISGPIEFVTIREALFGELAYIRQEETVGFSVEAEKPLGILELTPMGSLNSFTEAPGEQGDRFVLAIRKALTEAEGADASFAILRTPHLYENALVEVDEDGRVPPNENARVIPLEREFGFLKQDSEAQPADATPEDLTLKSLAEAEPLRWADYFKQLSETETKIAEEFTNES